MYSSKEPIFHKGMDVPGPCVNSVQQGAIMTRNFSFWCVGAITSPGLKSGIMKVLFLLMLVSLTQECGMSCACVGCPGVRCAQSARGLSTTWPCISAKYAHDQASSHVAGCGIMDSNQWDLSVLLFGIQSSQRSYTWLEIQIYRS